MAKRKKQKLNEIEELIKEYNQKTMPYYMVGYILGKILMVALGMWVIIFFIWTIKHLIGLF